MSDDNKTTREVVRGWKGRDGKKYRYVVYEIDGKYKNSVQKAENGRYVDVPRE